MALPHDTPAPGEERYQGRSFPSEAEWLHLPAPGLEDSGLEEPGLQESAPEELRIADDFVARTVRAVQESRAFSTFDAPAASNDFVARTVAAVHKDRRARWHELLARHVAPNPSRAFVARTLAALAADQEVGATRGAASGRSRTRSRRRFWLRAWPVLALAAAAVFWLALGRPAPAPLELRIAQGEPAAFAHAYAATPLPAVLACLSNTADPSAFPDGGADGVWLLLARNR